MARFLQEGYYARYLRRVSGRYKARRNALVDALGGDGDALRTRMLYRKVCA